MAPKPRNPSRPARPPRLPIRKPAHPRQANRSKPSKPSRIVRPGEEPLLRAVFLCPPPFISWACSSARRRELFHQPVVEVYAVVKVLHTDALVFSMLAIVIDVKKHARDAVGRDAGDARILPVRGPGGHGRDQRNARPGDP